MAFKIRLWIRGSAESSLQNSVWKRRIVFSSAETDQTSLWTSIGRSQKKLLVNSKTSGLTWLVSDVGQTMRNQRGQKMRGTRVNVLWAAERLDSPADAPAHQLMINPAAVWSLQSATGKRFTETLVNMSGCDPLRPRDTMTMTKLHLTQLPLSQSESLRVSGSDGFV